MPTTKSVMGFVLGYGSNDPLLTIIIYFVQTLSHFDKELRIQLVT